MTAAALVFSLLLGAVTGMGSDPSVQGLTFPVEPEEYEVGPGDVLWLTAAGGLPVQMFDSLSQPGLELPVTPDGYVVIPLLGAYEVSGMTLAEVSDLIIGAFRARFRGSEPGVGLAALRTFRVPVTGNVVRPGLYGATAVERVSDMLTKAGGVSHAGSWESVLLLSGNDTIQVDLAEHLESGSWHTNPTLSAGDVIRVPNAGPKVGIEGAVSLRQIYRAGAPAAQADTSWEGSSRGFLGYRQGETASALLERAGGLAPWAHAGRCYIMRQDSLGRESRIPAPMDDLSADPVLAPGDILVCPGAPVTVMVAGHVASPGPQGYVPGMDAGYYIASAGGLDDEADLAETEVVTPDGEVYDSDELQSVPSGSVISVPRAELVWWQDYLTVLTGVASVVIAWKSIF